MLARAWRILWIAVVTVVMAGVVRAVGLSALGARVPWVTFFPAVLLSSVLGGFWSGTVATALAVVAVVWFWNFLASTPFVTSPGDWLGVAVFAVNGILIAAVAEGMRRARAAERARVRELMDREARLRGYFDSPVVGVAVTSPEKGWLEVNAAAERMLGYTLAELRGKTWAEITHPDDVTTDLGEFEKVVAGTSTGYTMDKRYIRKDGSTIWAAISVSCVRDPDGGIEYFVALLTDITERKRADAALVASEATFRALADHSPVGIFRTNASGQNEYVNAAGEVIIGLPRQAIRGEGWSKAIHPEDRDRIFREWYAAVEAGRTFSSEYRFVHPDGEVVVVRGYGSAIRNKAGTITGFIGVIIDITQLRALREELAVSARLAALGTLVSGVSHEMNNPLAAAVSSLGFAEAEVRRVRQALDAPGAPDVDHLRGSLDEVAGALADAQEGSSRVASIVKSMAAFSRPEKGTERVSVMSVVEKAMRWMPTEVARQADVRITIDGSGDIVASEGQLAAILVNLVTNSAAAMPPGKKGTVDIRAGATAEGTVRIEVADDGAGMEPAVMKRMFDPFFSTRQPGQGLGMGLSITHAIVTALGGTITATSKVGVGTTFRIELPAAGPLA